MRNSDIAASNLGTISQSAFDRMNPADYPGAKVFVIGSAGALTEYSSLGTAWKQVAPFSDAQVAATQSLVSGAVKYDGPQLLTITIGNSINSGVNQGTTRNQSAGADPLGWWAMGSDIFVANMLYDAPLRFGRITATTRADKWGNYSYSGQTLDTINGDLPTQLYAALDTAGVRPDLIVGHSLLENDVGGTATYQQCVDRILRFVRTAQGRYPSARIWLFTPRPSFSYDSDAKRSVYTQISDYIMSLDDGAKIFCTRMNTYEDPASPARPLAGYTDATVHPNPAGGWRNGRDSVLPTLRRIVSVAFPAYRATSQNFALMGTGAASGTNVSGTAATGVSHSGSASITSAVMTANQPSQTVAITQAAASAKDSGNLNAGLHTITGFTFYAPYIKVRIDSGAELLRMVALQPRGSDGTTSPFFFLHSNSSTDADPITAYQNGDILTMRLPPVQQSDFGTAGALTSISTYLRIELKTSGTTSTTVGGTVTYTVLDAGVGLVS